MKNGKILVCQLLDFKLLYTLSEHKSSVCCLQIDEQKIVSGSSDESIIIWDFATGSILHKITYHTSRIVRLKFDKDLLISCAMNRTLLIFDISDLNNVKLIRNLFLNELKLKNQSLICNGVDLNGKYLVAGLSRNIGVWDRNERFKLLSLIEAHEDVITSLILFDEQFVISGSNDKTVKRLIFIRF